MSSQLSCRLFPPDRLIQTALETAGTGNGTLIDTKGLHALCDSLDAVAEELNFIGRMRAERLLVETLVKRLRLAHHLEQNPDIQTIRLTSPVFLIAPFRTGTTLLHRLLAQDPAHRTPRLWETLQAPPLEPAYRGDPAYFEYDPRVAIARRYMENRGRSSAGIASIHPSGADQPEECFGLVETSLMSHSFLFYGPVNGYLDWLEQCSAEDWRWVYALYADQLKLLDWWWSGERWVLKSPFHMWALDALLETFPDALIVQQHRSPAQCVASFCSLTAAAYRPLVNWLDHRAIGRIALTYLRTALARNAAVRRQLGSQYFIDIHYDELIGDPTASVKRIYHALGIPLEPRVESRMHNWLRAQEKTRGGAAHAYSLKDFGLDPDEVDEVFAAYNRFSPI